MRQLHVAVWALACVCGLGCPGTASAETTNVLLIVVDDLRPELAAYGFPHVISPYITNFAKTATLFTGAYCQFSICAPSRTSFLTGRRPSTTKVFDLNTYFRNVPGMEDAVTLPQFFKNRGYRVAGNGKIFHPGPASGDDDDAISWTEPYYHSPNEREFGRQTLSWQDRIDDEMVFPDSQIATNVIKQLSELGSDKFFIAMGLHKPHLPFVMPRTFLELYPVDVPLANYTEPTIGLPDVAWSSYGELKNYGDIAALGLPDSIGNWMPTSKAKELRRAYWASVSFIDLQIGRVLYELERLGLAETTAVALISDHGFHLGDLGEWAKLTDFEAANRVAMLLRDPTRPQSHGARVATNVELLDLYPTLLEVTGHSTPPYLEGKSLAPLLDAPGLAPPLWYNASFAQARSNGGGGGRRDYMGFTVRTAEWRYTEWVGFDDAAGLPVWDDLRAVELYDHRGDPGGVFGYAERVNVAEQPAYKDLMAELSFLLHGQNAVIPDPPAASGHRRVN